jgi:hypothetical protein
MGEFTQGLLKLTEFPFSYSLMGLLALIFGHGINLGELSFAKIGPLLILMGFVATTLSICDPIGAIQRVIIKGRSLSRIKNIKAVDLLYATVFGHSIGSLFATPYLSVTMFSLEEIKTKMKDIDTKILQMNPRLTERNLLLSQILIDSFDSYELRQIIIFILEPSMEQTIKTKWITAEVDRITALIYFVVVISVFIVATLLYPAFLDKFAQLFQNNESTKLGILIFSSMALIAVIIMFILRIRGLQRKASVILKYLIALRAIKTGKEKFKDTLQDIERYLDSNDWTLAEYWVDYLQREYTRLLNDNLVDILKAERGENKT